MAEGFLTVFIGMVAGWTVLVAVLGVAFAKHNRKKGAIIGAIVGIVLGSVFASFTAFDSSSPKEVPTVVAE